MVYLALARGKPQVPSASKPSKREKSYAFLLHERNNKESANSNSKCFLINKKNKCFKNQISRPRIGTAKIKKIRFFLYFCRRSNGEGLFCKVLKGKQVRFLYSTRCCKPHPFSEQKRHCRKMGRHSERGKSEDLPFGVLLTASGNRQFVTLGNSTVPKPFSEA